jgi:hypothetical protein
MDTTNKLKAPPGYNDDYIQLLHRVITKASNWEIKSTANLRQAIGRQMGGRYSAAYLDQLAEDAWSTWQMHLILHNFRQFEAQYE